MRPQLNPVTRWAKRVDLPLLCVEALLCATPAGAQRATALAAEVTKYVRVSTPRVILEHVRVIDGTGAAPTADHSWWRLSLLPWKPYGSRP